MSTTPTDLVGALVFVSCALALVRMLRVSSRG